MSSLTLRDVLQMPVLKQAHPTVLAGASCLDARVRWVHATELADIAPLLREGDLVLSTGIALPSTSEQLDDFAGSLKEVGVAGLMIELGRRWSEAPLPLVDACEAHSLPLIALSHEVKFAAITQAVGERVVDQQLSELREAERVHETFTELSLGEAGPRDILSAVQRLAGAAVVLETEQHRVLDYLSGPDNIADFLADWPARSRRLELKTRTMWDEGNGWLVTRVGHRDRGWGRLILQVPGPPSQRFIALIERAAAALALHRLHDRDRDNYIRRTHHELLLALQNGPVTPDIVRRCDLAGFPVERRQFLGITVRRTGMSEESQVGRSSAQDVVTAVVQACNRRDVPALIAETNHDTLVLLSMDKRASSDALLEQLATQVSRHHAVILGVGRSTSTPEGMGGTLREAQQVIDAVRPGDELEPARSVFRLVDVHVRGLLTLLGEDDRLRLFVSRELDALKAHDEKRESNLMETLRAVLETESKADAASRLHLSRAALYSRLSRIERLLRVRLDDVEIRTSLHLAIIADDLAVQRERNGARTELEDRSPRERA